MPSGHRPCVVDTDVLHHANQHFAAKDLKRRRALARRVQLLVEINRGERVLLTSKPLVDQYTRHLRPPFNDFVQMFLDLATRPAAHVRSNWANLSGSQRDQALNACRFPREDLFLLRTAYGEKSVIFSEENRVVITDRCIHRYFRVHVENPAG